MKKIYPAFRSLVNAPVIMANGAILYDAEKDETFGEICFDGKFARKVVREVLSRFHGISWVVYSDSGELLAGIPPEKVPGDRWRKMRFESADPAEIEACHRMLLENYGHLYNCTRSWYTITEIVDKTASKGNSIALERSYFRERGIDPLTVCAVGDFENDVELLRHADLSFCPENALPAVKAVSQKIVCHHRDGAVADVIEYLESKEAFPLLSAKPSLEEKP